MLLLLWLWLWYWCWCWCGNRSWSWSWLGLGLGGVGEELRGEGRHCGNSDDGDDVLHAGDHFVHLFELVEIRKERGSKLHEFVLALRRHLLCDLAQNACLEGVDVAGLHDDGEEDGGLQVVARPRARHHNVHVRGLDLRALHLVQEAAQLHKTRPRHRFERLHAVEVVVGEVAREAGELFVEVHFDGEELGVTRGNVPVPFVPARPAPVVGALVDKVGLHHTLAQKLYRKKNSLIIPIN